MTHRIPDVYAQNYRAAQYDGRIAEERRREALSALQEAQRRGDEHAAMTLLGQYNSAAQDGLKALTAIHKAFMAGVTARCVASAKHKADSASAAVKPCARCGGDKTPNVRARMICRACSQANAAHGCARAAANRIARRDAVPAPEPIPAIAPIPVPVIAPDVVHGGQRKPTAVEVFDAVCDTHGLGSSVPRMNPNAGRLKAGESLYPRREATV